MAVRLRCMLAAGAAVAALAVSPALAQSTASYTYDSEGRVTAVTYPSGASTTYAYDNADNRTNLTTSVPGAASPMAAAQTASVAPSSSVSIPVLQSASDPSNRPLSVVSVSTPAKGAASIVGDKVVYTSNGASGVDTFTYTITNDKGARASAQVTVTIAAGCTPPSPQASAATVARGSASNAVPLTIAGGPATSLILAGAPQHGTASVNGTAVAYTPAAGYSGPDTFSYTAVNACGSAGPVSVSLLVQGVPQPAAQQAAAAQTAPAPTPDAPTAAPSTLIASFETAAATKLAPGGVWTSLSVTAQPAHGSVALDGTTATYTPDPGYVGADSFAYVAIGPGGKSAPARVDIAVKPDPATIAENGK